MGVIRGKMKVLLEGPILTKSGYGEHARLVYESVKEIQGVEMFVNPVSWGNTSWISNYEDKMHEAIVRNGNYVKACQQAKQNPTYDVQIFVGILNEFEKRAPKSIVVTAGIETDRVSAEWLIKTYQGVDKIIVPSEHAKMGFESTSYEFTNPQGQENKIECKVPVEVIPYPVKSISPPEMELNLSTEFNFLNVALLGPRKNIENSIEWFMQEFKDDSNVGLIMKTSKAKNSVMDRIETKKHIGNILSRHQDAKCKVYLLHGNMTEEEIHSLYKHPKIKALTTATCGEGYGLPIFEAAYSGMPVIATDWSGHLDFLSAPYKENGKTKDKKLFAKVNYTLSEIDDAVVWDGVLVKGSKWAYANPASYKTQLRKVYKSHGMYKKWATALQEHILKTHKKEDIIQKFVNSLGIEPETPEVIDWMSSQQEIEQL